MAEKHKGRLPGWKTPFLRIFFLSGVLYDKNKKGFYVRQRKFEVADMRLLAECVYAAKFIAEGQAKRLVDVICDFVSEEQASKIKHNAFLTDRVKTDKVLFLGFFAWLS